MPSSLSGPIRRGQLIVPFGTGAMVTLFGGTTLVISGLDYWYQSLSKEFIYDTKEFIIREWRLEKLTGVDHFRTPPDFRKISRINIGQPNLGITIPAFRFPKWHFCPGCKKLFKINAIARGSGGKIKCPSCEEKNFLNFLFQVPLISICSTGHLNEFPWNEWTHRSTSPPNHDENLKLFSWGKATLAGYTVRCEICKSSRNLGGILYFKDTGEEPYSALKNEISKSENEIYNCPGERPWLGPDVYDECNSLVVGSLRSAMNVYYGDVRSSIYIPVLDEESIEEILVLFEQSIPIQSTLEMLSQFDAEESDYVKYLRNQHSRLISGYSDNNLEKAVLYYLSRHNSTPKVIDTENYGKKNPERFKKEENDILREEVDYKLLKTVIKKPEDYDSDIIKSYFSRIVLVEKLRETRALVGFSRIYPTPEISVNEKIKMLWKEPPSQQISNRKLEGGNQNSFSKSEMWLPATTVIGEGIYLEFNEQLVQEWERFSPVLSRVETFVFNIKKNNPKYSIEFISPRFLLIHTFSHLVMSRLTHECGYSSASLKERLYISDKPETQMAGVLIYTADGDSDGTLGGLVRIGKPGKLEEIIRKAITDAMWCSSDPVCIELGETGQGPGGMNMAACHSCCLVPETACENFNRFLDRGMVTQGLTGMGIGFFEL